MNLPEHDDQALSKIAHAWLERISSGQATEADRQALSVWLAEDIRHEEAFDRAETAWAAYDHLHRDDIDPELLPEGLPGFWAAKAQQFRAMFAPAPMTAGVMVVAITLGVVPFALRIIESEPSAGSTLTPIVSTYETEMAETAVVTLRDGTVVTLGARTRIESTISDRGRTVILKSGAAFFDVEPDIARPFSVQAGRLSATALGTEFDVRNNGGVLRVAVAEGRVEVSYPERTDDTDARSVASLNLGQGEEVAATVEEGLRPTRAIAAEDVGAWREQKLIYDGATLGELVADANRYSSRPIVLAGGAEALANRTITASFDATRIDRMLSMLALTYPITIDESDAEVVRLRLEDAGAP